MNKKWILVLAAILLVAGIVGIRSFESRPQAEKAIAANRFDLARTFYALDKWAEAEALLEGLHSEVPDDNILGVIYYGYLGLTVARKGNREEALKISQKLKDNKTLYLIGNPPYWRARIAAVLGDKEGVVNLLGEAIKQGYAYSDILCPAPWGFESLQDYPPFQQLMKPKG
jgi:tetratricopeptide (TPR) repeat protein